MFIKMRFGQDYWQVYSIWFVMWWSEKKTNVFCYWCFFCILCEYRVLLLSILQPTVHPLMWSSSLGTRSRALPSAERGLEFLGMPGGPRTRGDLGFVARDFAVVAAHGRWRSCTELMAHSFLLTVCWWIWTSAMCWGFFVWPVYSHTSRKESLILSGSKAENTFVGKEQFV